MNIAIPDKQGGFHLLTNDDLKVGDKVFPIGRGSPRHSVEQRCETVLGDINLVCYDVAVVPPGKYNKDDILTEEDLAGEAPDKPHPTDS